MKQLGIINIPHITGDIEIITVSSAPKYIIKDGVLLQDNYVLKGSGSSLSQKNGYVQVYCYASKDRIAPGISWFVEESDYPYNGMYIKMSNPSKAGSYIGGAYYFAGKTGMYGSSYTYADGSYVYRHLMSNNGATFSTPIAETKYFSEEASNVYVGIQCFYRDWSNSWNRIFYIYDLYVF